MTISSTRLYALFDILTHHEAYSETQSLKDLNTITHFGHPLQDKSDQPSAPLIQALIERFLVVLPGLRDVPKDFWQSRIKELFSALARADLSESYDKGSIGIRKTLATACAAIVEFCARGSLGGYRRREPTKAKQTYDLANPEDVAKAWDDFLQQIVYGDFIDRFFAKAATTDQLTDHEPLFQATHEYMLIIDMSEQQYKISLEYLALQLAIRDREEIVKVLCHHQPDLLTSSVEDLVKVYEPIIRALHNAIDLSAGMSDLHSFLHDLVEMSQLTGKNSEKQAISVEDYVRLLRKHQGSSHRFIHQALKNGKELHEWYLGYAKHAAARYRQRNNDVQPLNDTPEDGDAAAGDLSKQLSDLCSALSDQDRTTVYSELDEHAEYLHSLNQESHRRLKMVVQNSGTEKSEISYGPGTFLAKWQAYINATSITPATAEGEVRHGGSDSVQEATSVDVDGSKKGTSLPLRENTDPLPPNVGNTLRLLRPGFRELLVSLSAQAT
ncbi:MAG: hypothetical protein Q9195_005174 [Heterodermia aff. obscurata]